MLHRRLIQCLILIWSVSLNLSRRFSSLSNNAFLWIRTSVNILYCILVVNGLLLATKGHRGGLDLVNMLTEYNEQARRRPLGHSALSKPIIAPTEPQFRKRKKECRRWTEWSILASPATPRNLSQEERGAHKLWLSQGPTNSQHLVQAAAFAWNRQSHASLAAQCVRRASGSSIML